MQGQALFDKVVELSGVSAVLAPGLVKRALTDGPEGRRVHLESATVADFKSALPRILARLRAYLPEDEAQRRSRRIAAFLSAIEGGAAYEPREENTDPTLTARIGDALRSPSAERRSSRLPGPISSKPPLAVGAPLYEDGEDTSMGRRLTANEREILKKQGITPPMPSSEIRLDSEKPPKR